MKTVCMLVLLLLTALLPVSMAMAGDADRKDGPRVTEVRADGPERSAVKPTGMPQPSQGQIDPKGQVVPPGGWPGQHPQQGPSLPLPPVIAATQAGQSHAGWPGMPRPDWDRPGQHDSRPDWNRPGHHDWPQGPCPPSRPQEHDGHRPGNVVVIRDDHHHVDPAAAIAAIILAGVIVAASDHTADRPVDPVVIAKKQGTYFSCREEALANFKAKFIGVYTNNFACEPGTRPDYIPKQTVFYGKDVFVVYCPLYHSYGFWNPANAEEWIRYSVWNDEAMLDRLMLVNYYLYPTR